MKKDYSEERYRESKDSQKDAGRQVSKRYRKNSFIKEKYIKVELSEQYKWKEDMIQGFDKERERVNVEITIYGNVELG